VSWKRIAVLIVLSAVGGIRTAQGQAQGKAPEAASAPVPEAPKVNPTAVDPNSTVGVGVDPNAYLIGPQDLLYVEVFGQARFTRPVGVRPDGKITMPIIGDVQASGLTPNKLGEHLKQAYSDQILDPLITVTVTQVNSQKYTISGEISRAGSYPLTAPTHVFDALNNAGPFRDFANKKKIVIVRGTQRLTFNYQDFLKKGKNPEKNILLQNGDTIIVE
jgi:polysaccharide export outer membrane protein